MGADGEKARTGDWLANVGRVSVREAWRRPGDRHRLCSAVLGRWLRWEETGGDRRPVTAEPVAADDGGVHGAAAHLDAL